MEISEKITCEICSKVYEVNIHEEESENERVQYCSYCGEPLELPEEEEDDDNWDT